MKDVYLQYFKLSRLLRILEKNFSRTSASNSLLTNSFFSDKFIQSLAMIIKKNDGFIVFQKYLLSRISFSFKFAEYLFLDFFESETQYFLSFVYKILFFPVLFSISSCPVLILLILLLRDLLL